MADTKLSALTEMGAFTSADELYVNDGGTSKKATFVTLENSIRMSSTTANGFMSTTQVDNLANLKAVPIFQSGGNTYTFVLGDDGKYCRFANTGGMTVTVPTNAAVAFPIGAQISVRRSGAGILTVGNSAAVIVNSNETLLLRSQHSSATLVKIGTNEWDLTGDLTAS